MSVPMIILAITKLGDSHPTEPAIVLFLGLPGCPLYARVDRSIQPLEESKEYVKGGRVPGESDSTTIGKSANIRTATCDFVGGLETDRAPDPVFRTQFEKDEMEVIHA